MGDAIFFPSPYSLISCSCCVDCVRGMYMKECVVCRACTWRNALCAGHVQLYMKECFVCTACTWRNALCTGHVHEGMLCVQGMYMKECFVFTACTWRNALCTGHVHEGMLRQGSSRTGCRETRTGWNHTLLRIGKEIIWTKISRVNFEIYKWNP